MQIKRFNITLISAICLFLLNACTSSNPNAGMQTGAATGAIAGTVIGYNSKGHHKGRRAAIGGVVGAAIGAGAGNLIDNQNQEPIDNGGWD